MSKKNLSTIIDFGASNIRLAVFNEEHKNLFISTKSIIEKNNFEEYFQSISILIKQAEKEISNHLENITVMYDDPKIFSVDLSVRKDFDHKILVNDIYSSIVLEANQLIKNNHIKKKIIHFISTKTILDGKETLIKFKENHKAKSIILEIKFICLEHEKYNQISKIFKRNNLQMLNLFSSSYIKSLSYINSFNNYKLVSFLDIGYERSTILLFYDKKLFYINSIPIGGNHITKDISNVLNLNNDVAEKIKKSFNKSENEFSYDPNINENNDFIKNILGKNISIDILKKVVLARIEEIFENISKDLIIPGDFNHLEKSLLVLIGNGSRLFDKNSFHLDDKFSFKEISFYEEDDSEICKSAINFETNFVKNDIKFVSKNKKKQGIFEKFFNFFGR